jgi:photosystem II stability/assembly factor-like uncharacterized protein
MPGLRLFQTGFYQNIGANQPIQRGTINLGCTRGRGSSTRMFNYCNKRNSYNDCINQFITINQPNNNTCLVNNWKRVNLSDNSLNFERIAMSYDGQIQTLVIHYGNIYTSYDYGNTWIPSSQNFSSAWFGISMSSNGQYQTAVAQNDHIHISNDYGLTWVSNTSTSNNNNWNSVCISQTGQYQTAVGNGYGSKLYNGLIFVSSDYGITWNVQYPYNNCWTYVAMSNSGRHQTVVSLNLYGIKDPNNVLGFVFNSDDYGITWSKNMSLVQSYYSCVGMNGSGEIQVVGVNDCNVGPSISGPLYISRDYGKTFTQTICPYDSWLCISFNNIGNVILACSWQETDSTGKMMVSYDYGNTWQQTNAKLNTWTSAIISKNGCIASASAFGNGVFITN